MSRRHIWETLIDRFDPTEPADDPAWRARRPLSPFESINLSLDLPRGRPHVLLTGTIGTGKTTELLRIAETRARKEFVVFLDLVRHFEQVVGDAQAIQHVSAWEVCFLAGVALLRSAEEQLDFQLPDRHLRELEQAWLKVAQSSDVAKQEQPGIDVAKLAKSMVLLTSSTVVGAATEPIGAAVGAGLSVIAAALDAGKWSLPIGRKKKALSDQDSEVQTLLGCVNTLIGLVQKRASKVLLIIDGLDRIEEFERAKDLFIDSQMIGQLACPLVVCGPFSLRRDGYINNLRTFSNLPPVVNVPVLSHDDPSLPGPGIPFFHELFSKRVADLSGPELLAPELLARLAYYSGGRAREFVVLIHRIAELAWGEDAISATSALVDKALDELRRQREIGLHRGHIRLLEEVMADPDHLLPADELAGKLLTTGALLPYPDGSEWYYPHPLLTMRLLRKRQPGSTSSNSASG